MKVKLLQAIRFRSDELPVGTVIDVSDADAKQLIAAEHAEEVPVVEAPKTSKEK